MKKTILITGSTDGIGLATARMLTAMGHDVLAHGRNPTKLNAVTEELSTEGYVADLSRMGDVEALARIVAKKHTRLDVLINNAGVFKIPNAVTPAGQDLRFAVNTIAPYLLTKRLLPLMDGDGRVINLSSAAQAPVDLSALAGDVTIGDDFAAYAQSKLALTMWSRHMALACGDGGPAIIAVNPGSMLGSKMVKEAFGSTGEDIQIGAEILSHAALSDAFAGVSGQYFDNDSGRFASPHPDGLDPHACAEIARVVETIIGG